MAEEKDENGWSNLDLHCLLSPTFRAVSITVYAILCITTIFGNTLLLLCLIRYSARFKGTLYMLIGNLAVADLLLGLCFLLFIFEEIFPDDTQEWLFCVVKPVGVVSSYTCSTFTLLGMSFDRFMAVIFPLKYRVKTHRRKFILINLIIVWIISLIIGSLPVVLHETLPQQNKNNTVVCTMDAILPSEFELIISVGLIMIIILNCTMYGIILRRIKTKECPGNNSVRKASSKTVMMITVCFAFIVCWLPFIICSFIIDANLAISTFQNVVCARGYVVKLGYVNSALNWVIYGLANIKFRLAFSEILCCK